MGPVSTVQRVQSHWVNLHFCFSHSSTSTQTSHGQGGQGNWVLDSQGLVNTQVMKRLWSRERRSPNIHQRTWMNWKTIVYQRNLCLLVQAKWGTLPKLILSSVEGSGLAVRGPRDLRFPGPVVRCFWVRRLMTGRPAAAIELGIVENGPDTKVDFHRSLLEKQELTARRPYMGGSMGPGSAQRGSTGPGLLPSQTVRSCCNSMTQVIKAVTRRPPGVRYCVRYLLNHRSVWRRKVFVTFPFCFPREHPDSLQGSSSPRLQWRCCPSQIQFFTCQGHTSEIRIPIQSFWISGFPSVTPEDLVTLPSYYLPNRRPMGLGL